MKVLLPFWKSPPRFAYTNEGTRYIVFDVAQSRKTRRDCVRVEITAEQIKESDQNVQIYFANRALQAARERGWIPSGEPE